MNQLRFWLITRCIKISRLFGAAVDRVLPVEGMREGVKAEHHMQLLDMLGLCRVGIMCIAHFVNYRVCK